MRRSADHVAVSQVVSEHSFTATSHRRQVATSITHFKTKAEKRIRTFSTVH